VADTWSLDEEHIVVTTGLRGIIDCEIELTGQPTDLHSGCGGAIPNPIGELMALGAALHTVDGRVNVPGFYDTVLPPTDWEREQLRRLPMGDADLGERFGVKYFKRPDGKYSAAETMRFLPSLEFNGIGGGFQGEGVKTIIPHRAFAKVSCRLIPNQRAEAMQRLLAETLRRLCPPSMALSLKMGRGVDPYLCDIGRTGNRALARAKELADGGIAEVFGNPPTYLREGGSIGFVTMLKEILGIDSFLVGLTTAEDNVHAPDESMAISMLEKGRKFFRSFLAGF
jgi:acetylornithine deacetylase/succinyl-diaminopimelate desuccinylase-like protein